MEKILLFSDDEKLFEITKQVTEGKQELIWGNYQCLETNGYPFADVVIMHFDEEKIKKDIFQPIIKVKGRLGHSTPILAVIENGSMQDIFSVLKIGVYDYIETTDNLEKYQKKIQDIILWEWYLKKYKGEVKKAMISVVIVFLNNIVWKNYMNTRFFYKKEKG
ncbi:hypothetical protein DW723_16175 [Blautia obeum]|nr:hypothetical protein DW723_16175 [Blautia obeum]